ncbi:LOW QUALITY PROTEIN: hypothetical protein SPRG_13454 [Saprolegnia parasitica CBS 223.65]|uniref:Uncharacterized protein n=1 Tax=Saprolegnia parasitica (strain CBS 223.65) TaxID=695850 RepID=A0A067BTS3_SAPPC|nr:LOW QUALITY PROTEIN: hypothetical protein SPRG_13454 [Saprolegnia parasitica CBS 223.65]KDO20200.1 LOW QUALITY PROTEIN: hypothetical protein SPRG_13454 [Saprolegnia parasitica CBS 223.65]|eukprot:XP_012209087.1 LOW QUALITY PROTEIN: hypothetical protein SPRG_13454 [Saprolegnia parasitica CBS 223.65]
MYQPTLWSKLATDVHQLMQSTYAAPPASNVCPSQLETRNAGLDGFSITSNKADPTTNAAAGATVFVPPKNSRDVALMPTTF